MHLPTSHLVSTRLIIISASNSFLVYQVEVRFPNQNYVFIHLLQCGHTFSPSQVPSFHGPDSYLQNLRCFSLWSVQRSSGVNTASPVCSGTQRPKYVPRRRSLYPSGPRPKSAAFSLRRYNSVSLDNQNNCGNNRLLYLASILNVARRNCMIINAAAGRRISLPDDSHRRLLDDFFSICRSRNPDDC